MSRLAVKSVEDSIFMIKIIIIIIIINIAITIIKIIIVIILKHNAHSSKALS